MTGNETLGLNKDASTPLSMTIWSVGAFEGWKVGKFE
jgi:hypothetical protein